MKKTFILCLLIVILLSLGAITQKKASENSIAAFVASWNETDDALRSEIIQSFWKDVSLYEDHTNDFAGIDKLDNLISEFQDQNPNTVMYIDSLTTFNNYYAWYWYLSNEAEHVMQKGYNYAELDEDGNFIRIISFTGK
jgi:hypothetical protein